MPGRSNRTSLLLASALLLAGASCGYAFTSTLGLGGMSAGRRLPLRGPLGPRAARLRGAVHVRAKDKGSFGKEEKELFRVMQESRLGFKDERAGVSGEEADEGVPPQASVWETMKGIFSGGGSVGPTPLLEACIAADLEKVKRMISQGADVNQAARLDEEKDGIFDEATRGYTPLREACVSGNAEVVRALLEAGAEVDHSCEVDDGATSVFIAAATNKIDVLRELCAFGANLNVVRDDGATALHIAVGCEHLEMTQELLKLGAYPNVKTKEGATPLREAVVCGRADIAEILVEAKADCDAAGQLDYGATPLCIATAEDEPEVVKVLIKGGANVNLGDDDGATPVFIAVAQRKLEILDQLIAAGADLNGATDTRSARAPPPPLCVAAAENDLGVVEKLIAGGADVNYVAKNGENAMDVAVAAGHAEVVARLEAAGARR